MPQLDTVLTYLAVILAGAFIVRPFLYKLVGRKAPSSACHSDSGQACDGGCSSCPVAQKAQH